MRRWNGWGEEALRAKTSAVFLQQVQEAIGEGTAPRDASREQLVAAMPVSRLPTHPLTTMDGHERLRHAVGQSFPDLVALRGDRVSAWPDGVAFPRHAGEVRALLQLASEEGFRIIPRGGGTSVVGGVNTEASEAPTLVLSLERMQAMRSLEPMDRTAVIEAGATGPQLEAALQARGFTLGHFPQSFEYSTLGGWIATRSRGQEALGYGRIEDWLLGAKVELPTGSLEVKAHPAASTGPELRELVLGSEGRFGVITEATVRVRPVPEETRFVAWCLRDWNEALTTLRTLATARLPLTMLRLSDPTETRLLLAAAGDGLGARAVRKLLGTFGFAEGALLVVGLAGDSSEVSHASRRLSSVLAKSGGVPLPGTGETWRRNRFRTPYLRDALWERGYCVDTVETSAPWSRLETVRGEVARALRDSLSHREERVHVASHVSHVYEQGANAYLTFLFRAGATPEETLARWRAAKEAATEMLVRHGATVSHQHGVGRMHRPWIESEKGALGLQALRSVATTFDPAGLLNPGALV